MPEHFNPALINILICMYNFILSVYNLGFVPIKLATFMQRFLFTFIPAPLAYRPCVIKENYNGMN